MVVLKYHVISQFLDNIFLNIHMVYLVSRIHCFLFTRNIKFDSGSLLLDKD